MKLIKSILSIPARLKRLNQIDQILSRHHGGLLKRVDENRELLDLLNQKFPAVMNENSWVKSWLSSQDQFLNELLKHGPEEYFFQANKFQPFPREWKDVEPIYIDPMGGSGLGKGLPGRPADPSR